MRKTLVIGVGVSGVAAICYLLAQGKKVIAVDRNPEALSKLLQQFPSNEDLTVCLESEFNRFDEVEEVVLSSGVRSHHPLARQFPYMGEAQLVLRNASQKCIGITGTNGKTTVTLMVEHVLNSAGMKARALGNIGKPLAAYFLSPDPKEVLVVELSSYQLETLSAPVFDAAVLLNMTPDHLDEYASMEDYAKAKCGLQLCMKEGKKMCMQEQAWQNFGHLLPRPSEHKTIETFLGISYRNRHDRENLNATWSLVKDFGVTEEQFMQAVASFKKPPHRIEFVETLQGVSYFDDSKGTNIDAVIQAVHAMEGTVILIAGGVDKGSSYHPWIEPFDKKVKKILVIGQAAPKMVAELSPFYEMSACSSLEEAVQRAAKEAKEGECVLLSPGCASFDMFRDYAHRGEEFKRCVHNLRRKP